jgi:hypothetical protein
MNLIWCSLGGYFVVQFLKTAAYPHLIPASLKLAFTFGATLLAAGLLGYRGVHFFVIGFATAGLATGFHKGIRLLSDAGDYLRLHVMVDSQRRPR